MTVRNRNYFQTKFVTGYRITHTDYVDFCDTFYSKGDETGVLLSNGVSGTFTTVDGKTISVLNGQLTSIV